MRILKTLTLLVAVFSAPIHAVTDHERSALHRLNTELESVTSIIDEAQHAANSQDRELVDYQRLRDDLQKIQHGIIDAASSVRREPRSLPPIDGDYH